MILSKLEDEQVENDLVHVSFFACRAQADQTKLFMFWVSYEGL